MFGDEIMGRLLNKAACLLCVGFACLAAVPVMAIDLVAHWRVNEEVPPYADSGGIGIGLLSDALTSGPLSDEGVEGLAARLHVATPPVSTRLYAGHPKLSTDSFGFSFWLLPVSVNPYDNLIAREMAFYNSVPADERMAWQVRILGDNGSGFAAVELVVRGDQRSVGNYFGAAVSGAVVPLYAASSEWIHIAGGYDTKTGALRLYVNGVESAVSGVPGARNSGNGAFAVGTAKNGADVVAYAASCLVEDIQLYSEMLLPEDVEFLMDYPGQVLPEDFEVDSLRITPGGGGIAVEFGTEAGGEYMVQASTGVGDFTSLSYYESSVNMVHDAASSGPWTVAGREGDAVLLRWSDPPGLATRLFANNDAIQTDSFGLSFWVRPVNMNPWDNLVAKEMAFDNSVPGWSRMAWQVHLLGDNGSGFAPLELVVRGADRSVTNFYGLVTSTVLLPLYAGSSDWIHVAAGYDAQTGELSLTVNGQRTSTSGIPGADNSDGSPLALGTVRNGNDVVQYAAVAILDDVQLYDRPLSSSQAQSLLNWPGTAMESGPGLVARWPLNELFPPYKDTAHAPGLGQVFFAGAELEAAFGTAAQTTIFFRVYERPANEQFERCE